MTVRWSSQGQGWQVKGPTDQVLMFTKAKAISEAVRTAKACKPSELVIYGKNGRVQDSRSYGTDPRRTKG